MRKLLLLRPEPGLSASAERARTMGLEAIRCPLFRVEPVIWTPPDPADYDGLLLTSANAVRYGGLGLGLLKSLPVHAVGAATAAAAEKAGFQVEIVGNGNAADLLSTLPPSLRLLHLAGQHRRVPESSHPIDVCIVYRSVPIETPELPSLDSLVIAVHSPRAAGRLADLVDRRDNSAIAAISAAAAEACGGGWERVEVAELPDDSSLLALAATLCHTSPPV
jgi:uroporphyrinogen-III synthase